MYDKLLYTIREYNPEAIPMVIKAYQYAELLHSGQFRESGEPYIIHPLNVAYNLAILHADSDTICAGLLHDTLEDTNTSKEEIEALFNSDIANLVDGVTKINKMNFSSKKENNLANTRKIITSIMNDVRIIIIKLCDRLHNMETLQYKNEYKQKENAIETLDIYVPFAYYIGAYRIKSQLEDLSFKYLMPDKYSEMQEIKSRIEIESDHCLNEMLHTIKDILNEKNIPNDIKIRTKNLYGIYKRLEKGNIHKIHDLLALKIMVDNISNCYQTLGIIHSKYHPMNEKFRDYLYNPKTNMYQSLHTTVFGPENRLVQAQIRTFDMDKIASFGLTTYWDINKGDARYVMQQKLTDELQFYKSLKQIDKMFSDNSLFVDRIKNELFTDKVYVYTRKGDRLELPIGSTPIDFAYSVSSKVGNHISKVIVNDEEVDLSYNLKNNDRVYIITDQSVNPSEDWIKLVHTTKALRKINEYIDTK